MAAVVYNDQGELKIFGPQLLLLLLLLLLIFRPACAILQVFPFASLRDSPILLVVWEDGTR